MNHAFSLPHLNKKEMSLRSLFLLNQIRRKAAAIFRFVFGLLHLILLITKLKIATTSFRLFFRNRFRNDISVLFKDIKNKNETAMLSRVENKYLKFIIQHSQFNIQNLYSEYPFVNSSGLKLGFTTKLKN